MNTTESQSYRQNATLNFYTSAWADRKFARSNSSLLYKPLNTNEREKFRNYGSERMGNTEREGSHLQKFTAAQHLVPIPPCWCGCETTNDWLLRSGKCRKTRPIVSLHADTENAMQHQKSTNPLTDGESDIKKQAPVLEWLWTTSNVTVWQNQHNGKQLI